MIEPIWMGIAYNDNEIILLGVIPNVERHVALNEMRNKVSNNDEVTVINFSQSFDEIRFELTSFLMDCGIEKKSIRDTIKQIAKTLQEILYDE